MVTPGRGRARARGARGERRGRARLASLAPLALALVLASAFVVPLTSAQVPPLPATPLDPVIGATEANATRRVDALTGDLQREDIDVHLDMIFRDVDFDTLNVIFGGGKFSATARIDARIDIRVVAASRLQDAAEKSAPGLGNVTGAVSTQGTFVPADAFRATFAGEALRAFQDEQEERLAAYLSATIPNVTVLNTAFVWSNISPEDSIERRNTPFPNDPGAPLQPNDPTFPPLTLRATVDVEYLERTSILDILEKALKPRSEAEKQRKADVADAAAAYDRSAFGLLGIRQVLALQAPAGWNVAMRVQLPEGFTFEEASPDVAVARDLREAQVLTLGKDANDVVLNPVALTLSNRFLVSTAMLAGVLLLGTILRFPVMLATNYVRRKRSR